MTAPLAERGNASDRPRVTVLATPRSASGADHATPLAAPLDSLDGRCPTCGSRPITWSPTRIVAAAHLWNETHGSQPSANKWRHAAPEHPSHVTVLRMFGTWNAMMTLAGFETKPRLPRPRAPKATA